MQEAKRPFTSQLILNCIKDVSIFKIKYKEFIDKQPQLRQQFHQAIIFFISTRLQDEKQPLQNKINSIRVLKQGFDFLQYGFIILIEVQILPQMRNVILNQGFSGVSNKNNKKMKVLTQLQKQYRQLNLQCIYRWAQIKPYFTYRNISSIKQINSKFTEVLHEIQRETLIIFPPYEVKIKNNIQILQYQYQTKLKQNRDNYIGFYKNILTQSIDNKDEYYRDMMQILRKLLNNGDQDLILQCLNVIKYKIRDEKQPNQNKIRALSILNELFQLGQAEVILFVQQFQKYLINVLQKKLFGYQKKMEELKWDGYQQKIIDCLKYWIKCFSLQKQLLFNTKNSTLLQHYNKIKSELKQILFKNLDSIIIKRFQSNLHKINQNNYHILKIDQMKPQIEEQLTEQLPQISKLAQTQKNIQQSVDQSRSLKNTYINTKKTIIIQNAQSIIMPPLNDPKQQSFHQNQYNTSAKYSTPTKFKETFDSKKFILKSSKRMSPLQIENLEFFRKKTRNLDDKSSHASKNSNQIEQQLINSKKQITNLEQQLKRKNRIIWQKDLEIQKLKKKLEQKFYQNYNSSLVPSKLTEQLKSINHLNRQRMTSSQNNYVNSYESIIKRQQDFNTRSKMLKDKFQLFKNNDLQVQASTTVKQYKLQITITLQSYQQISQLSLSFSKQSNQIINFLNTNILKNLQINKKYKILMQMQLNDDASDISFESPKINLNYKIQKKKFNFSVLLPCSFLKFFQFFQIDQKAFKKEFRNQKNIIVKGESEFIDTKILTDCNNINNLFQYLKQIKLETNNKTFFCGIIYKDYSYLLKFIVLSEYRFNLQCLILRARDQNQKKIAKYIIDSFNKILCNPHS